MRLVKGHDSPGSGRSWRDISAQISQNFRAEWNATPITDRTASPKMQQAEADGIAVSRAVMPSLRVVNRGSNTPSSVYWITRVSQESVIEIEGQGRIRLLPDEFILLNSKTRCDWIVNRPYETSSLHIEEDLFREQIADPARFLGRQLRFPYNLRLVLGQAMDAALEMAVDERFSESGQRLVRSFLEILALAETGEAADTQAVRSTALDIRREQIKAYVRRSCGDPNLSVENIAQQLRVSPRYVQLALASESLTPSGYIKQCRLEAAQRMLRSSEHLHLSITQIALECGFSSSAYFSTEFRRLYDRSPREFRSA